MIKVFIFEDNDARRQSLADLLAISSELQLVGSAPNCKDAVALMKDKQPDVVLMDINMPVCNGIEGLMEIKKHYPNIRVLMQTIYEDNDRIFESIRNGASGYILKKDPPSRLLQAIMEVNEGGAVMNPTIAQQVLAHFQPKVNKNILSDREYEVMTLLADGKSYKMIAADLSISYNTVNSHVKNIYLKLHVESLGEAIAFYYRNLA